MGCCWGVGGQEELGSTFRGVLPACEPAGAVFSHPTVGQSQLSPGATSEARA